MVFPQKPSVLCTVYRQQGRECRGAAGELPVGPGALQQIDPAGCQQEPAGHHLHTGVPVSAHQRGECSYMQRYIHILHTQMVKCSVEPN